MVEAVLIRFLFFKSLLGAKCNSFMNPSLANAAIAELELDASAALGDHIFRICEGLRCQCY